MIKDSNNEKKQNPTANKVRCWDNVADINTATKRLKEMFVEMGQKKSIEKGQNPAERAVFRKQHGIAYGNFVINKDIASQFQVGIFAGDVYECAIRFSSDTGVRSPDLDSTIGVGIKLFGVEGPKLFGDGSNADFIFQNNDRFFARDAQQMCRFTTAGAIDGDYDSYIDNPKNKKLKEILSEMKKEEGSCLSTKYWAILPFKLGKSNIVKYRLIPEDTYKGTPTNDTNYLRLDLEQRLRRKAATFRFEIQLRTDEDKMPLDDAQKGWSTKKSPYICIAKLHLPQQDICAIGQAAFGSNLAFNIWRTLEDHEPLGSIAAVRKVVYAASAEARHQANGQQNQEPKKCSSHFKKNTEDESTCIVKAGIYPPIGVMRVGNSEKEYFIGPLVDTPVPQSDEYAYRDKMGALKRQAAQFRIYGFNAAGKAVKELTSDNSKIIWNAHLANQKSSWYQFQIALDIPEATNAPTSMLRNIDVKDRSSLIIDGGAQSISGSDITEGAIFEGEFQSKSVYLGEMRTDKKGHLIMLGGHGKAENINGNIAVTFANNEGWYDDISDGPITAEVEYDGVQLKVDPAWVICAPPDYAPMQKSVRTMWDLMRDVAVHSEMMKRPIRPSFTKDILPVFERMTNLQWVNAGFAGAFGWGGQFNYTTLEWVKRLNDPSPANTEMRRTISNNFRRYNVSGAEAPQLWPWLYGDAMNLPAMGSVRQHSTLSKLQLDFLDQWVKGDFDADFVDRTGCPHTPKSKTIDELPIEEQPDMLTKAAMEFCLADAFHPGCEMTWPMRTSRMYMAPFRLKHKHKREFMDKSQHESKIDRAILNSSYYGPVMGSEIITLPEGPILGGQVAGGITRWMAIPWQTDTASCRDGYTSSYDPYLPTFWPARVPNDILDEKYYKKVTDSSLSEETRKQAFTYRTGWLDDLPLDGAANYTNQINSMVTHFDKLAIVQPRQGIQNDPNFPVEIQVGIKPTKKQEEALREKAIEELTKVLNSNNEFKINLNEAIKHLSKEGLLTEQDVIEVGVKHLSEVMSEEFKKHFEQSPSIKQLLGLLKSKILGNTTIKQKGAKVELGVIEKVHRFSRHTLK